MTKSLNRRAGDRRHNLANTTLPELPLRRWGV